LDAVSMRNGGSHFEPLVRWVTTVRKHGPCQVQPNGQTGRSGQWGPDVCADRSSPGVFGSLAGDVYTETRTDDAPGKTAITALPGLFVDLSPILLFS
jgi:hypothetical protein